MVDVRRDEIWSNDAQPKVVIVDDERLERLLPVLDEIRTDVALHVMSVRSDRDLPDNCSRWSDVVDRRTHRQSCRRPISTPTICLHFLHLRNDWFPEGRPTHPPRLGTQCDESCLHEPDCCCC